MIPSDVDYDLWCGPAAKVDLYRPEFALRLALGFQHRQRRHGQPGHPPDGRRPLVPGRAAARAAGDQRRRPARLRGRRQHAQHADRAARLRVRAADLRDARFAEVEGRQRAGLDGQLQRLADRRDRPVREWLPQSRRPATRRWRSTTRPASRSKRSAAAATISRTS